MDSLKIETTVDENDIKIDLIGAIDEDADFSKLLEREYSKYSFNFDKVNFINSCGIREWIIFVEKIPVSSEINYSHCPSIIIDQINMVKGFIPERANLNSFYAPYFCEECDDEKAILLNTSDICDGKAPQKKCDECSTDLEFDAIEKQFFHFTEQYNK